MQLVTHPDISLTALVIIQDFIYLKSWLPALSPHYPWSIIFPLISNLTLIWPKIKYLYYSPLVFPCPSLTKIAFPILLHLSPDSPNHSPCFPIELHTMYAMSLSSDIDYNSPCSPLSPKSLFPWKPSLSLPRYSEPLLNCLLYLWQDLSLTLSEIQDMQSKQCNI